jgi:AAA ATPase domain
MQPSVKDPVAVADAIFVGREAELGLLRSALAEARAGRGSFRLLTGEPGIGKSRTAAQLATEADGFDVYWGRCREDEGAPAFWPWIEIVRAYLRRHEDGVVRAVMSDGAADIGQVVPEVIDRCAPEVPVAAVEGPAARYRLFDSFTAFLRHAALQRPLLINLDDLHWADRSSLLLLEHVLPALHDAPVMVVGTYRPVEAQRRMDLADTLGEIARHGRSLLLSGLSRENVEAYLSHIVGANRARQVAESVHERTEGNALFMGEVARLLARVPRDSQPPQATDLSLTEGIRHTIRKRLDALSGATVDLLHAAAVIGREFELGVLEAVWRGQAVAASDSGAVVPILDLLDEACADDIIERDESLGRYRFTHPLVRDTLEEDLSSAERMALHREIARALEGIAGERGEAVLTELAHHFVGAAGLGDEDKAVDYARRAGDRFRKQFAYEEAAAQYQTALRVLNLQSLEEARRAERERLRAALLLDLGRVQACVAYEIGGREAFSEAADLARKLGDAELLAEAVLGIVEPGNVAPGGDVDKARLIEEALDALGEGDHPLRALLLTRSLVPLYFFQARDRALRRSAEAVAIAERVCDEATLGQVLGERLMVLSGPDDLDERARMAERLLDLAGRSQRRSLYLKGHSWSALNLLQRGEVERARAHLDRHAACAEEQRQPFDRWQAGVCKAMLALLVGELEGAEELALEACGIGQTGKVPNAAVMLSIQLFRIRLEQGRLDEIEPMILEFARSMAHIPAARGPLALAYGHMGRVEESRRAFDAVASGGFGDYPRDSNWLTGLTDAAHVCWFVDDRERAALLYDMLLPHAPLAVMGSWFAACSGTVAHYLGLLATVLERWDAAHRHFELAAEMYLRMGAGPLLARARLDHADMLLREGTQRARAAEFLREGILACEQFGMPSWRARGERLLGGIDDAVAPRPREECEAVGLFRCEGDVWTLSYEGTTVRVKDLKGLHYIRTLLREPEREFHIADLAGAALVLEAGTGSGNELLDARARLEYRRRLGELQEALDRAEDDNDLLRATRAREEIDRLTEQLSAAYMPGAAHAQERSAAQQNLRKAVAKNIRSALGRIQAVHEPLWRHLYNAVRTGVFCSYRPERHVAWSVD